MNRPRIRAARRLVAYLVLRFSVRRWLRRKTLPYRVRFIRWARDQNPEPTMGERRAVLRGLVQHDRARDEAAFARLTPKQRRNLEELLFP